MLPVTRLDTTVQMTITATSTVEPTAIAMSSAMPVVMKPPM